MPNRFVSHYSFRSFLILFIFLFLPVRYLFSQQVINGRVINRNGILLASATVAIKGSKRITVADSAGRFVLSASSGEIIEVSYIGYRSQLVKVGNETELIISLDAITKTLDDLLLIGYGTARRKDITGAVDRITENDFNKGVITSPLQQ